MTLKTIKIEPEHLKVSNKKSKKKIPILSINEPNLRQALLNKLIQRRKTQKKSLVLPVNEGSFDDVEKPVENKSIFEPEPVSETFIENKPIDVVTIVNPDKPYGVLKNGNKPTFKEWKKDSTNDILLNTSSASLSESAIEIKEPNTIPCVIENEESIDAIEKPLIKKIRVGKNKKTKSVDVLIENINTRKLNKEKLQLLKKTNISTIKNYLKNRQLIKVGSNAPNTLMRYMYENIKVCGDVINENKSNLIHNFTRDTIS